ncbi:hypothetical protein FP2506_16774 [Fulvimarina pelagi HTCC2506]|uniref:Uncharacterized protein n=1 Tax=Fulvimarina pelagi HTCC2506 TaxID=314231 RepID=Q0G2S5_9HYPH|nr:dimethylamine monooxygenase subunit DmmA family protein [Fulvimarina pelagi]EAU42106.1 hypothetical protein FP2506_16774 [Fulvimarina pelagi HTCC2506]
MSDIKSRPIWGRIRPVAHAARHFVCCEGSSAARHVAETFSPNAEALKQVTILYGNTDRNEEAGHTLDALGAEASLHYPTRQTLLISFKAHLKRLHMGAQIYLCGPEAFLNEATAIAESHGVLKEAVQTELCGANARRVQCVHCKGLIENVAYTPIACEHCGVNLMVRDHYSRRLGAFMGVCVDAEAPGDLPARESF